MHKITAFIIAETARAKKGKEAPAIPPVKSAPHYFEKSVPNQFLLKQETVKIDGKLVELVAKTYHPDVILVEGSLEVENVFGDGILELKDKLHDSCYEFAQKNGAKDEPAEEYTIYQIFGYKGDPELFLRQNAQKMAGLLKSEKLELDEKEVEYTLSYQLKYAKDDLAIVDWDGAFLFDPEGESGETIELLELANYQLLRYRILDQDLDERIQKVSKLIEKPTKKWFVLKASEVAQAYREVIKVRTQSVSEFESLDREIKLIGDWYSARLYDLTTKKFKIDEWRNSVKEKLEFLEDIYSIVAENFSISSRQVIDAIQLIGWLILMVGWFVLLYLEIAAIK